jgi:hypothetical protein
MTEPRTLKTCQDCFTEIDARASFCPHCRLPQSRPGAWLKRHRILTVVLWILLFYAVIIPLALLMQYLFPTPFSNTALRSYNGEVKVASSRMVFGQSKDGPVVSVVGLLKNESDFGWRQLELDVQYFDRKGELIDVGADTRGYYLSTILPRGEIAFKFRGLADLPADDYASYKVFVRVAADARRWP